MTDRRLDGTQELAAKLEPGPADHQEERHCQERCRQVAEMLTAAGVRRCLRHRGRRAEPMIDALRRNGSVDFVHARHEEYGAFAAGGRGRPDRAAGRGLRHRGP
jgi:thiamine pyrophosphate-dependent acetolactate synthase large subunit-like protein